MIMPFGVKATGAEAGKGPPEVDFDLLWKNGIAPALRALGYAPVRADQDTGALIIHEMLRRLAYADLVIADVSIANANVYYEIGVRHAARGRNCVLIGASWSKPVFDLAQMRRVSYDLVDARLADGAADEFARRLAEGIRPMIQGTSPVFEAVPNYPTYDSNDAEALRFNDMVAELLSWSSRVAAIASRRDEKQRTREALQLRDELLAHPALADGIWLEMLLFIRDTTSSWPDVLDWIARMPPHLQVTAGVQEQKILAEAKRRGGDVEAQAGALKSLIAIYGASSERCGLLGGRYKTLFRDHEKASKDPALSLTEREDHAAAAAEYLNLAIDAYRQGMICDLNDYYPSSNLPLLLKTRDAPGDAVLARTVAGLVELACEREEKLGKANAFRKATLLVAAFLKEEVDRVRELARAVRMEGRSEWQLDTALRDIDQALALPSESPVRAQLVAIRDQLRAVPADKPK
jgi:hypothetical protein